MSARWFTVSAFVLSLLVAGVLSAYASGHPDGLEHVAHTRGFLDSAAAMPADWMPFPGYAIPSIEAPRLAGGGAGVIGCAVTFAVVLAATKLRHLRSDR